MAIESAREAQSKLALFRETEWQDAEGVDEEVWQAAKELEQAHKTLNDYRNRRTTVG